VVVEDAHHSQGHVLAFSHAADVLASGGSDGAIRLWRLPDGARVGAWLAHGESVYGLAFLQNDQRLLSAGYDGHLALWRRDGALERETHTPSPITALAVAESRAIALTGHEDGYVRQWRLPELVLQAEWHVHRRYVRAVAIHAPTGRFASSGADRQVHVWRALHASGDGGSRAMPATVAEPPRALPAPPTSARDLAFTPDGRALLGGGWFKLFRWNLATAALQVLPTEHGGIVTALDVSADGRILASISRQLDSAVLFLDPETGATRQRFQKHDLCGENISLSRDGRWLATTADDGSVRLWDLKNSAR
jgi:WD40 repeat protein